MLSVVDLLDAGTLDLRLASYFMRVSAGRGIYSSLCWSRRNGENHSHGGPPVFIASQRPYPGSRKS